MMSMYDDIMVKPNTEIANLKTMTKQSPLFLGNLKFVLRHYYCRWETILLAVAITMCNSRNSGFWETHCFKSWGTGKVIVVTHCFSRNDQIPQHVGPRTWTRSKTFCYYGQGYKWRPLVLNCLIHFYPLSSSFNSIYFL